MEQIHLITFCRFVPIVTPFTTEAKSRFNPSALADAEIDSLRVQLLANIRDVFEDRGVDRISSEDLVQPLVGLEERPWFEHRHGKPALDTAKLARQLRPFGVVSGSVRLPDRPIPS